MKVSHTVDLSLSLHVFNALGASLFGRGTFVKFERVHDAV